MGKTVIVQKRGKGGMTYRAHSFHFLGQVRSPQPTAELQTGVVMDLVKCPAHTAPLAQTKINGKEQLLFATEGMKVGDTIVIGQGAPISTGNILSLAQIPEGTLIHNIESVPGDGGKFVRASGLFARVVSKTQAGVVVRLPSKKQKILPHQCRASIGIIAGGGRTEKPLLKAGNAYFMRKKKNRLYPTVAASAMNAVNHPYGNKRTSRHAKKKPVSRHAPPGRKVGPIAARRMGRKR
jgi:large subunit ribosomal protein L2